MSDRLDDAAEARRHPAGEHDLRDLPAPERIESRFARRLVVGLARCRKPREILGARRLDRPSDEVRLRRKLPARDACTQHLELRLVEPEPLEDHGGLAIDVDHRAVTAVGSDDS